MPWRNVAAPANATVGPAREVVFAAKTAVGLTIPAGAPDGAAAALVNRGGGGAGLWLQVGLAAGGRVIQTPLNILVDEKSLM
jgi:hypothetical protein